MYLAEFARFYFRHGTPQECLLDEAEFGHNDHIARLCLSMALKTRTQLLQTP